MIHRARPVFLWPAGVVLFADQVSKGQMDSPEFDEGGKNEISVLGASFNRMRRSLEKAMNMLDD